jgi:hypothetical protein
MPATEGVMREKTMKTRRNIVKIFEPSVEIPEDDVEVEVYCPPRWNWKIASKALIAVAICLGIVGVALLLWT